MAALLEPELRASLQELGLPMDHVDFASAIMRSPVRNRLMAEEQRDEINRITDGSFWDIGSKYRFDILALDTAIVASRLAFAVALSNIYMPHAPNPCAQPLLTTVGSELFWYHLDTGFRLASSGWDRIALLLDLAFNLELKEKTKLRSVLQELQKKDNALVQNEHFKALKAFRDNYFPELDGSSSGLGIRHETTHRLSIGTRFVSEFLEQFGNEPNEQLRTSKALHEMLLAHYSYYIEGISDTVGLLQSAS